LSGYHANRLVTDRPATFHRLGQLVRPEIDSANTGTRGADHRIDRFDDRGVRDALDANVL